ncbi:MAG: hypothetical protein HUK06_08610 [Bacteroidaceae bacterium]|nr:hypothetical protein [Bacteroidaceae bacterium]
MSNKNKRAVYRERREKQMEQQGRSVIRWISVILLILFVIIFVSTYLVMQ